MNDERIRKINAECDFCVIGGGLAGSFAALSAARHGAKVILIQDRPMLGGNASSEIRMWVRGAKGEFNRETGLISEFEERIIHGNPTLVPSVTDAILYGMLRENGNIELLFNTSCMDARAENGRIVSVEAWQTTTYTRYEVKAKIFADCSGDSILAPLVGAKYRLGRESADEFGERLAQSKADNFTMGMSIILAARETDKPVKFMPPSFANVYPSDECFDGKISDSVHEQLRTHRIATSGDNLWWVELGGDCGGIHDADRVRDELLACIYGVWDHIKNRGDHGMENWDLDWVGFLPGKRESRRYEGDVIVTESDILGGGKFDDEIAYGGWPLDDHNPLGMKRSENDANVASRMIPVKPYGLPLRALYSVNIENLMFAGRNISVTHVALSSTRVMGTCSLLGQAAGTAAAVALKYGLTPRAACLKHIREIQKILTDDGVFLPHFKRETSDLTLSAKINLSAAERDILFNGIERPRTYAGENSISQNVGDRLVFSFDAPKRIESLRLRFDPDFGRASVSENAKMRVFAMKLHTGADFKPVKTAATIVKSFDVYADGKKVFSTDCNFLSLVRVPLGLTARKLEIEWKETHGASEVRLFSADLE